ncbi:hypothetical protein ACM66B_006109 [Microbotryomycetes sp. NB124-2]
MSVKQLREQYERRASAQLAPLGGPSPTRSSFDSVHSHSSANRQQRQASSSSSPSSPSVRLPATLLTVESPTKLFNPLGSVHVDDGSGTDSPSRRLERRPSDATTSTPSPTTRSEAPISSSTLPSASSTPTRNRQDSPTSVDQTGPELTATVVKQNDADHVAPSQSAVSPLIVSQPAPQKLLDDREPPLQPVTPSQRGDDSSTSGAVAGPSTLPAKHSSRSSGSSSKSILTMALQRAQSAVLLDSANNVPAAIAAYSQSVRLLQEVMARVEENAKRDEEKKAAAGMSDRSAPRPGESQDDFHKRLAKAEKRDKAKQDEARRLRVIHDTYKDRIRMLQTVLTPSAEPATLPASDEPRQPISAPLMTSASAISRSSRDGNRSISSFGTVSTPPASFSTARETADRVAAVETDTRGFGVSPSISDAARYSPQLDASSRTVARSPVAQAHPFAFAASAGASSDALKAGVLPSREAGGRIQAGSIPPASRTTSESRPTFSPRTSSLHFGSTNHSGAAQKASFASPSFSPPPSLGPEPDSYLQAQRSATDVSVHSRSASTLVNEITDSGAISQRRRIASGHDGDANVAQAQTRPSPQADVHDFAPSPDPSAPTSASLPSRFHPSRRPGLPSFNSEYLPQAPLLTTASRSRSGPGPEGANTRSSDRGDGPATVSTLARTKSNASEQGRHASRDSRQLSPRPPPSVGLTINAKLGKQQAPLASPVSPSRRPFHLLLQVLETLEGDGAYVSPRLYVPRQVWLQTGVKLPALETKVRMLDLLATGLESVREAATRWQHGRAEARTFLQELDSLEGLVDGIQSTLSKKLGLSTSTKKGPASFSSWSSKLTRSLDRVTNGRSLDHPATYIEALTRALQYVHLLDNHLTQCSDNSALYAGIAPRERDRIEQQLRRTSEFFGQVVCRFVMQDVGMLLDKYVKRAGSWFDS